VLWASRKWLPDRRGSLFAGVCPRVSQHQTVNDRQIRQGEMRMRRIILAIVAAAWLSAGTGCLIPMYSADPARRAQELIYTSEDLRAFLDEWERIWFLDMPDHMTPRRVHGGVM
jgi:hypothetical protein